MSRACTRPAQLALVVFVDHSDCRWLRHLRTGFRHCFVALRERGVWLTCDPLKDRIELSLLPIPADFDLARFYADCGHTVLLGQTRPDLPRRAFAIAPLTCVTIAKRLLGVRAPWLLTPWQLCRHLKGAAHNFVEIRPNRDRAMGPSEANRHLTGRPHRTIHLSPLAEPCPTGHPTTAPAGRSPRSQLVE
jgi:hypothetical protein